MKSWQLQEAKAHLSQVVKDAINQGPQEISLRGEPAVIILSVEAYDKLSKPKLSFVQFMRQSPWADIKLNLKRDHSVTRDIEI